MRKPEGKRILRRLRRRWDVRFGGTDWIDLAQDKERRWALVNAVMSFWVP